MESRRRRSRSRPFRSRIQPPRQRFAHRARVAHRLAKRRDGQLDLAGLLARRAVGLSVALEAAALVEMKERAPQLVRLQGLVETITPKKVRVGRHQRLPRGFERRHQAALDQGQHEMVPALEITIPPPPHLTRPTTLGRQGGAILGIPAIGVDSGTKANQADRLGRVLLIEQNDRPADGVGSEVKSETVAHGIGMPCGYNLTMLADQQLDLESS